MYVRLLCNVKCGVEKFFSGGRLGCPHPLPTAPCGWFYVCFSYSVLTVYTSANFIDGERVFVYVIFHSFPLFGLEPVERRNVAK